MEGLNPSDLVERLGSDEDPVRKMAAFKLQGSIGDPSFAEIFIAEGGLAKLRYLTLVTTGNTLAYSLTSFARLLEVDKGWEYVDEELVERIVYLIVTHPLVNILRGAMSMLVSIVSHPYNPSRLSGAGISGFRALKPAISKYPQFLEMLVSRLSSADHALCANALQLINSLMRDSIANDEESEWPKFIKRLQDLGVIRAVYILMQGSALQDHAHPLIEFQSLTKLLLRKWKNVVVDLEKPDHRRALKGIHIASNPEKVQESGIADDDLRKSRKHNPEKWRRLGFHSESPASEFYEMGFLGMMDLTDFVRKHQDEFQKMLLEQSAKPVEQRCPIARASLAITSVLYEHFEVERSATDEAKNYLLLDSRSNFDKVFKPLLLHWSRIHVASLHAFFRLWKATSAETADFDKIVELVRILVESVVGGAPRTKDVQDVEEELTAFEYQRLRELQMELLELTYEDAWGQHLRQVRDELQHEALQFVKEQRIRCLLQGAWFPNETSTKGDGSTKPDLKRSRAYKYVQLSHNRRYLHFGDFDSAEESAPSLDTLPSKIDLTIVSSVVSNVSASSDASSGSTIKTLPQQASSSTKITIHGYAPSSPSGGTAMQSGHNRTGSRSTQREIALLVLRPQTHSIASEWLDGLLMLLSQQPITSETNKLVNLISNYGLKIRLLNVRFDDAAFAGEPPKIPSRDGLDEDYYYDLFGGAYVIGLSIPPAQTINILPSAHPETNPPKPGIHPGIASPGPTTNNDTLLDSYQSISSSFSDTMAAPPAKRQRKLVVLTSSDNEDEKLSLGDNNNNNNTGAERKVKERSIKSTRTRAQKPASNNNSSSNNKKRKETATTTTTTTTSTMTQNQISNQTSPRSLHRFFQPATEEQRWAAHRPAATAIPRREEEEHNYHLEEIEDDLIEDDDYGSFDEEIFEILSSKETVAKLPNRSRQQQQQQQQQRSRTSKPRPSKRFILDDIPVSTGVQTTKSEAVDRRPWPERYAPANIEELAVHKKKVADVRSWLTAALSGRSRHKILVLHGPAGSGKTTTISLLSRALGFSIVEWKSPVGTESADGKYTSLNAQFDEFLNRSDGFGSLDLTDSPGINSTAHESQQGPASQRIILIEEFPNSLSWGSSALSAFRTSLRRYLASDSPLSHGVRTTPPVVIVISETRLATSASISDNLTMHRLLGPEIYTNPGASTIEFNPIAPTFMRKALDLILKKEARDSMRQRIPGPGVLKKFSELGDIRSAISSLQFFCLRGDKDGDWGGRVAAKPKSADTSLTLMEKDSLEIITQRESSLGLFHAVGKVVYNKREDMTPEQRQDYVAPPSHLQHLERPKISLVSIEDLINETGTDIQTFTAALHENYPPSCDGPNFTDSLTACIEYLSDSDLLGSEGRSSLSGSRMGIGMARGQFQGYGASIDRLRQDEVSFHVAVRGLLFSLPYPVKRKLENGSGKRSSDTYKMHFPTSQRLWKDIEEMDGLIGVWGRQLQDPTAIHSTASRTEGVASWKLNQMNTNANDKNFGTETPPRSMMSREDVLLHQLPYLTKILGNTLSSQTRGLDRITQFKGITAPSTDEIPDDDMLNETEPSSVNDWSTDPVLPARRNGRPGFHKASKEVVQVNVQEAVENLLLSDDEIED